MEESLNTQPIRGVISTEIDCDNTNFSMISDLKSVDYNFETSNSNDSLCKLNSNGTKEQDNESLFDADMDEFDANDFIRDSPLSENLEIDKLMEQLNDSIENGIFSNENITDTTEDVSVSNESSLKDDSNLENIAELNLMNNDIISYINSDDTFTKGGTDDTVRNICHSLLEDIIDENKIVKHSKPSSLKCDKSERIKMDLNIRTSNKKDIIDLINEELDNTLQFTNVLCHYVYSDVIVGKDFFKLFCSKNVKTNVNVVDNAVI